MKHFMNKKIKNILLTNLILTIVIFFIIEIIAFGFFKLKYTNIIKFQSKGAENPQEFIKENTPHYSFPKKFNYTRVEDEAKTYKSDITAKKRPIVTIGCSYTYGCGLEENQTFAYKLNKITGRTTYNRGIPASGPQLVYRQISDKNFKSQIPESEYIIYTFIYSHLNRQFRSLIAPFSSDIDLNYSLKNDTITEKRHPFWFMYWSFAVKTYLEFELEYVPKNEWLLFYKTMEASVNEMKKKYPNCKFVLLEFPDANFCWGKEAKDKRKLTNQQISQLEELGIIYINSMELVGHDFCESKYRVEDKDHPSELAWNELLPNLVEKLKL